MIAPAFHAWERRLASVDQNRFARPFEWGLDWLGLPADSSDPAATIARFSADAMAATDAFYAAPRLPASDFDGENLEFESAVTSPFPVNNRVRLRVFPARARDKSRPTRAVLVLPQWNADEGGHVGLCRGLAYFGITAVRLVLPYHEQRRPPHLERAEYIVNSNVGQTLVANRQAVLDARRAIDWIEDQGYTRIGIIGTSLGSCLSMLTMSHDTRIRAGVFNHISPYFADVVWRGLSTTHVHDGLEGHVTLEALREYWMPISPWPFIDRVKDRRILLIYALYDLTFPVDLSRMFLKEFTRRGVPHKTAVLPCGHYTTGKTPFKFIDGYYIVKNMLQEL
ncbi:MAG TPA: alpha/beta hydrolase family protein [Vicinamibacterales bacterium]|nr:alpha/beta hydrolase family protein [Vicinamibacterales bacterium]